MASTYDMLVEQLRRAQGAPEADLAAQFAQPSAALPGPGAIQDELAAALAAQPVTEPPTATPAPQAPPDIQTPAPTVPQQVTAPPAVAQPPATSAIPPSQPPAAPAAQGKGTATSSSFAGVREEDKASVQSPLDKATAAGERMAETTKEIAEKEQKDAVEAAQMRAVEAKRAADAEIEQSLAKEAAVEQARREATAKMVRLDAEIEDLARREPDPSRFWNSRTSGQKVAYFLTAALQAVADPTKVPSIHGIVMKMIDDDIGRQDTSLQRQLAAAQGKKGSLKEQYLMQKEGDEARFAEQAVRLKALQSKYQADIDKFGSTSAAGVAALKSKKQVDEILAETYKAAFDGQMKIASQRVSESQNALAWSRFRQERADAEAARAGAGMDGQYLGSFEGAEVSLMVPVRGPDGKESFVKVGTDTPVKFRDDKEAVKRFYDAQGKLNDAVQSTNAIARLQTRIGKMGIAEAMLDPEVNQMLQIYARGLASASGEGKVLSNQEQSAYKGAITMSGEVDTRKIASMLFSSKGELTATGNKLISYMRDGAKLDYEQALQSAADPNFFRTGRPRVDVKWEKPLTADEIRAGAGREVAEAGSITRVAPGLKGIPIFQGAPEKEMERLLTTSRGKDGWEESFKTVSAAEAAGAPEAKYAKEALSSFSQAGVETAQEAMSKAQYAIDGVNGAGPGAAAVREDLRKNPTQYRQLFLALQASYKATGDRKYSERAVQLSDALQKARQ